MRKFCVLFFLLNMFLSGAQELPIFQNCDSTLFVSLQKTEFKLEHLPCTFKAENKVLLFTSLKEFQGYYKVKKNEYNLGCYSLFGKFDFKNTNMLVIHYALDPESKAEVELRKGKTKYYVLIRIRNKMSAMAAMPSLYHKYIILPKEVQNQKPEVIVCYTNE